MTMHLFRPALATITIIPAAAAAVVDWRTHRVPNLLVVLALVPVSVAVMLAADRTALLVSVAVGAAAMALPLLVIHLLAPAAMGFGDVKLAAALGAALGGLEPRLAVPALAAACGLTLLAALWKRRSALPFAPGLVGGTTAAVVLGALEGWRFAR